MPTYEEIFGPTYDTPIENYPEDYLNKTIVYPVKRSKESETTFGRQPKNRIDQIVEEPEKVRKVGSEIQTDPYSSKKEEVALQNVDSVPNKTRLQLDLVANEIQQAKGKRSAPISVAKTSKRGDNII